MSKQPIDPNSPEFIEYAKIYKDLNFEFSKLAANAIINKGDMANIDSLLDFLNNIKSILVKYKNNIYVQKSVNNYVCTLLENTSLWLTEPKIWMRLSSEQYNILLQGLSKNFNKLNSMLKNNPINGNDKNDIDILPRPLNEEGEQS